MSFPAEYRARILRENGGEIELEGVGEIEDDGWWLYPVRDDSTPRHPARSHDDVVRQTQLAAGQVLPRGAVVLGEDGCGNRLLLLSRDQGADGLEPCVWDHETGELTWLSLAQVFAAPGPRSEAAFHASIDCCFPYLRIAAFPGQFDALNVVCCACDDTGMGEAERLHDDITTAWAGGG